MLKKQSAGFLLLACTLALSQSTPSADRWIAVRAGHLFAGSDRLAANQVILIRTDRIVKVGPAEKVQVPADAELVDLTHATVLPGLIDAHTHVFGNGPDFDNQILRDSYQYRTLTALANAQKDLMVGFTTLRDLRRWAQCIATWTCATRSTAASSPALACRWRPGVFRPRVDL